MDLARWSSGPKCLLAGPLAVPMTVQVCLQGEVLWETRARRRSGPPRRGRWGQIQLGGAWNLHDRGTLCQKSVTEPRPQTSAGVLEGVLQTSSPKAEAPPAPEVTSSWRDTPGQGSPPTAIASLWLRRVQSSRFHQEAPLPVHTLPAGPDVLHLNVSKKTRRTMRL